MTYTLTANTSIIRDADSAVIPDDPRNAIALDPCVYAALIRWVEKLKEEAKRDTVTAPGHEENA